MNLMSSTLLTEDTGVPFEELQAEQIALYRAAWKETGWEREPRVSVSRTRSLRNWSRTPRCVPQTRC